MTKPLPVSSFSTLTSSVSAQFEAWRESMAPMLDVAPLAESDGPFFGEFESYLVGPLVMGGTTFDAHAYGRSPARVQRDGLNHFHVILYLAGSAVHEVEGVETAFVPGDITLIDFSRTFRARAEKASMLVVALPRDALEKRLPPGVHHGLVLRGDTGLGGLLGDFLKSLVARLPTMTVSDTAVAVEAVLGVVASCFGGLAATASGAPLLDRIRQYIGANLDDPPTVTALCKEFAVSRSLLYRLLEADGGVGAFIRNQRLSRAFTALMSPHQRHRRVAEIGFEAGYQSEATFSRAFRKAFGVSPSEVRAVTQSASEHNVAENINASYRTWITHLRRL